MSEFPLIQKIIIFAVPIVFAITVHEVAHGWVASKLGDQTAKFLGRLTLNPIKHIDPIGTILVPVVVGLALSGTGNTAFEVCRPDVLSLRDAGQVARLGTGDPAGAVPHAARDSCRSRR